MGQVNVLFWDIGGVLLSNGWDRHARARAEEHFHLEHRDFDERHHARVWDLESGNLSLDSYLTDVVFHEERPFTADDFKHFIYAQSHPYPDMLEVAKSVRESNPHLMAMLNNESLEINQYRIEQFGLRSLFDLFLTSCFLGMCKPDPKIYELALQITQTEPGNVLFIDDREENLVPARHLGFRTIHHQGSAPQLIEALRLNGVAL